MIKRKLLFAAVLFAVLCFCLIKLCGVTFLCEMPKKQSYVTVTGKIDQIENKTNSQYIFLKNARNALTGIRYGKIIISADAGTGDILDLKLGSRIEAECKYIGFNISRNAGNFDEQGYYHSLGISGKFLLEKDENLKKIGKGWNYIKQLLYGIKKKIVSTFDSVLGDDSKFRGFFSAIVAGEKNGLDNNIKELYQDNGIIHILAISGLHISMIGMSLFKILRRRNGYPVSCLLSSLVMVGFCIMCGGSVSAVRATVMFIVRMLAEMTGKTFDMLSAMALSAILILAGNPNIIFNGAFLLSFSAILGVGVINEILAAYYDSKSRLLKAFIVSFSVSLATMPVITSLYYEIPLYAVILNLIVVPLMSYVLGSGILCGIAGALSVALGRLIIGAGVYLLSFVEILCTVIDRIPCSIIITGKPAAWKILVFYFILAAGLLWMKRKSRKKKSAEIKKDKSIVIKKAGVIILWASILFAVLVIRVPSQKLIMTFFDVGQGEGYLIQSPSGKNYLIDGGSATVSELMKYRLESAIKYRGVSTIHYSIITHTDTDHISGVIDLLKDIGTGHISIENLVLPELNEDGKQEELIKLAKEKGTNVIKIKAGDTFKDGDLSLSCIHPEKNYEAKNSNGLSLVFILKFGNFKAVLTGDIGLEEETNLAEEDLGGASLLKVAHHGSRYSSTSKFLQQVFEDSDEKIAVISAGVNNSYGHPHKETLNRLKDIGTDNFCTAECGEITVTADKKGYIKVEKYLLNF